MLFMLLLVCLWITGYDAGLADVLALSVAAGSISTLSGGLLLSREIRSPSGSEQVHKIDVLRIAFPFLVTNLTLYVLNQTDIWIVGVFHPEEDVALYGAAIRLMTFVAIPLQVINSVVPPMIARMHGQGEKVVLQRTLQTAATLAAIPALSVVGVFTLFGQQILRVVYGDYYAGGATVLALICVGQLVNVWAGSCGQTLMMTGHQTTMMVITVLCSGLTLAFRLAVVEPYGIVGVAAVTTVGLVLQNLLMLISVKRQVGIWTYSDFSIKSIRSLF
jgi:O-antigen/teichoic acid export membrane protein